VAEVDLDLSEGLYDAAALALRSLYTDHRVLVVRSPGLAPETQVAVMACLGNVLPGEESEDPVHLVSNDSTIGTLGRGEIIFHADLSFSPNPYSEISLYGLAVEDGASSTLFADAVGALSRLPLPLRRRLEELQIVNALDPNFDMTRTARPMDPSDPAWIWARWPAIRRHPRTGEPVLWTNLMHTAGVDGLDPNEAATLLREVYEVLYDDRYLHEHRWRGGDLVIWDNIGVQHARRDVSTVGQRTLRRVSNGKRTFTEQHAVALAATSAFETFDGGRE
jgi:taurine dioxygenase